MTFDSVLLGGAAFYVGVMALLVQVLFPKAR